MKQPTNEMKTTAQRLATAAPESEAGWYYHATAEVVTAANWDDGEVARECAHTSRKQLAETIAWSLYVKSCDAERLAAK